MDLKGWIFLLSVLIFMFGVYQATNAAELGRVDVLVDEMTIKNGYTVKSLDQSFWLPVFPNQYDKPVNITIKELNSEDKAVSDVYEYDIRTGNNGFLIKPALLSREYSDDSNEEKAIYFYDNGKSLWRKLPSTVRSSTIIQAKTIFPYAKIAVFNSDPNVYVKESLPQPVVKKVAAVIESDNSLTAVSALVINKKTDEIVFAKNINDQRSIASLTKLMSALVFLDHNPGWSKVVTMKQSDFVGGASLWVKVGDSVTVKDLFYSTMVGSKNNAVMALARSTGLSFDQFVSKMNQKAIKMGLTKTRFVEPTGLNEGNVSTAAEMAEIALQAFNRFEVLQASTSKTYTVTTNNSGINYPVRNTSLKVLNRDLYVTGTKTGWTDEAGYCLATQAKKGRDSNQELIALVMGAKISQNYEEVYGLLTKYLK